MGTKGMNCPDYATPADMDIGPGIKKWDLGNAMALWHICRDAQWCWRIDDYRITDTKDTTTSTDIDTDRAHQILKHLGEARALAEEVTS